MLITRDPVEAITSHLVRKFQGKLFITNRSLRRAVESEVDIYVALLFAFYAKPKSRRLYVRYEELTDKSSGLAEAQRIIFAVLGDRPAIAHHQWQHICEVALTSQSSLGEHSYALRERIANKVALYITYEEVEGFLATGEWPRPHRRSRGAT